MGHLAALGLVSVMSRCVIVRLIDFIEMLKKDCFGETKNLFRTHLGHHELESEFIIYCCYCYDYCFKCNVPSWFCSIHTLHAELSGHDFQHD